MSFCTEISGRGQLFGKDCLAGNLVVQINKFRYKDGKGDPNYKDGKGDPNYKDGKGDPKSFTTFLEDNKLPRGILPRYRGNRLYILFHICGKLVELYDLCEN